MLFENRLCDWIWIIPDKTAGDPEDRSLIDKRQTRLFTASHASTYGTHHYHSAWHHMPKLWTVPRWVTWMNTPTVEKLGLWSAVFSWASDCVCWWWQYMLWWWWWCWCIWLQADTVTIAVLIVCVILYVCVCFHLMGCSGSLSGVSRGGEGRGDSVVWWSDGEMMDEGLQKTRAIKHSSCWEVLNITDSCCSPAGIIHCSPP